MTNLSFQYPFALWLLLAVPVFLLIYLFYVSWKKKARKRIGDPALVREMSGNHSSFKSHLKFYLALLVFAAGCIAAANPRIAGEGDNQVRSGIDLVFAVDISNSMLATDITPNRLTGAKNLMLKILEARPNDRIALVVFAGNTYVQLPLTYDHSAARMFIRNLDPSQVSIQGTAIDDALEKTTEVFMASSGRYKAMLLLTDGETHDNEAFKFAEKLANGGVMISTVGFGSPGGTTLYDPLTKSQRKDQQGAIVISKLNETLLQQLAAIGKGHYIHFQTAEGSAGAIVKQLSTLPGKGLLDKSLLNYKSLYLYLVIPMFLLLVIDFFLTDRKRIKA